MEKRFLYDALNYSRDSIRLLQILPGSITEEIHCQIEQFTTSERPSYCALSYCWGIPDRPRPIILNHRRFFVHQNLWWLLQHLRSACEGRKLWIDAICIDQSSIKERNHQVGMMGTIYEQANTVLAWLGQTSEDSEMALELLTNGVIDEYDAENEVWAALANLCRREYWYRTWIIQELLLASNIELICGDTKVSWKALERVARFMPSKPLKLIEASGVLKTLKLSDGLPFRFMKQRAKRQLAPLSELLRTYQDSKCIDPRDKIYAMLSLASDCRSGESLVADYSKGLCQLFLDVVQFCQTTVSRDRLQFGFLLLKILNINPFTAASFLNQCYRSGWLPLKTLSHSNYLNRTLDHEDRAAGLIELCGTYVGAISDVRTTIRPNRVGAWSLRIFFSEVVKTFSRLFVEPNMTLSYDPITVSTSVFHIGADSSQTRDTNSPSVKKISILSDQFKRSAGIACCEAQVSYQVYQLDKSGLALVCDVTARPLKIVGEAIITQTPEFSLNGGENDIQRFTLDVIDFLALTRRGGAIDSEEEDEWTPLSAAGWWNHEAVRQMLSEKDVGLNIDSKDGDGRTILLYAALKGHQEVVRLLLEKQAPCYSINKRGESRETALHVAASNGHEVIVRLLLEKGAAINANNQSGNTALQLAAANGHEKVVRLLLQNGAALLWRNCTGETAMQLALLNEHGAVVRLLQEHGQSMNEKDEVEQKALRRAAADGDEAAVRLLLEGGISPDEKDKDGLTALHDAAAFGHMEVVRLLLRQGASMYENEPDGKTVLQSALQGRNVKILELFLNMGADANARDEIYGNILQSMSFKGREKTVELLLTKGADVNAQGGLYGNALQAASCAGNEEIAKLLIERGANVNAQGGYYDNALHAASFRGHSDIVKLLVAKGADVNAHGGSYNHVLSAASS